MEALLATVVISAAGAVALDHSAKSRRAVDARNIGEYMSAFQSAALSYATDANAAIISAAADGTGASTTCVGNYVSPVSFETLNNVVKHTCAVDVSWLIHKGFLPGSFKPTNALGQAPVAIYKLVYNGAVATENLELFVVAASTVGTKNYAQSRAFTVSQDAFAAANLLGTHMGVVPADMNLPGCEWDPGNAANRKACGTQGTWTVQLSDFIN